MCESFQLRDGPWQPRIKLPKSIGLEITVAEVYKNHIYITARDTPDIIKFDPFNN